MNAATEAPVEAQPENFKFESNVSRVMDIIINSLYSNKDVFVRELVCTALLMIVFFLN
jgi:heat shock protein 90kDa beta